MGLVRGDFTQVDAANLRVGCAAGSLSEDVMGLVGSRVIATGSSTTVTFTTLDVMGLMLTSRGGSDARGAERVNEFETGNHQV